MNSHRPVAFAIAVVGVAAFGLPAPLARADTSSQAGSVEVSRSKKCKTSTPRRRSTRSSLGAAARRKCKKARTIVLRRTYRGTTSQGERIELETNNLRKNSTVGFYAKHTCYSFEKRGLVISDQFEQLFPTPLRGTAFFSEVRSFDSELSYVATVTGNAGARSASGQANITGNEQSYDTGCAPASFTFNIPKVKEVRGAPRRR